MPTVLVVEDDPGVLELVARILRRGGYDAVTARDGREAWGIFQRAEPPIDLLVADVVMPHNPANLLRTVEYALKRAGSDLD